MRPILLACMLAMAIPACVVSTKQVDRAYTANTYGQTTVPDEPATAQNCVSTVDKVYVAVEVVYHASQGEKYPVTLEALEKAIKTWASVLPVRVATYVEDRTPITDPMFPFPIYPQSHLHRPGIIEILMDDLQAPAYGLPNQLLGLWRPDKRQILLDADYLEKDPKAAYSVVLHEFGHLFGVPHVISIHESGLTGYLVLPDGEDAQEYVMYPGHVIGKDQDVLSPLEIAIAQHHVLHRLTDTWSPLKQDECTLHLSH